MPTPLTEQDRRVADVLLGRAEYHERIASQYRQLIEILFPEATRADLVGRDDYPHEFVRPVK